MSQKINDIKAYYEAGLYTRRTIDVLYHNHKITLEEYNYILGITE